MKTGTHVIWHGNTGMSVLLALLLVVVFVVPVVFQDDRVGRLLTDGTITLVLLTGAVMLPESRRTALALGIIAIAAVAIRWIPWALPDVSMPILRETSAVATFVLFAVLVGMKVFAPGRVTLNRISAAVTLYLLLGLAWAMTYELLAIARPDAFTGSAQPSGGHVRWVYFSFVTLTTVGFGDITPLAPLARMLTVFEALVGQLYPVVLLGRLVSLEAQDAPAASR